MSTSDDESFEATHWGLVRRLFHEARDLSDRAQADLLDRRCVGNDELRRKVEQLLAADSQADGFLEPPAPLLRKELEIGQKVGPFRVAGRLGAGNMGQVYRAEREAPFRMSVALKVIDAAKVDDEMIWRFQHERQILALLVHPNIARLIDGGTLDDDRPWFALEFVEGERIDHYCDRLQLTIRERVKLFRKALAAVSEAHGLAIVHRDLKPANILVASDGEPKLLDFGIAKMLEEAPIAASVTNPPLIQGSCGISESEPGSSPLTPLYASPEQAARILDSEAESHSPISVRSDVYSLGVVLYELLTGHPPYREIGSWQEILQAVVDEVPGKSSEVVATERSSHHKKSKILTPASIAALRRASPRSLRRQLAGDLDAVIHRALEKEPRARYPSVAQFDADLQAYLEGYPVTPRQSSSLYRAGRFLRRNVLAVVATTAMLSILIIYFVMDWRAKRQLLETREFLFNLTQIKIEELTDDAFAKELRQAVVDDGDSVWLADKLEQLGLEVEARGHLRGALALYEENLDMRHRLLGDQHPDLAASYNNLAGAQLRLGQFEEAEENYFKDLAIREKVYGPESLETSRGLNNLAALYQHWGGEYLVKARSLLERSLNIREQEVDRLVGLEEDSASASFQVLATLNNLATQSLLERRFADAETLYQQVLSGLESQPDTEKVQRRRAGVKRNYALVQLGLGNLEAAEINAREALATYRRNFIHWRIADAESVLGACLAGQDRLDEARYFLERSLEDLRHLLDERSRHVREAEERQVQWLGG